MATKPDQQGIGKQQEVLEGLQKAGTLKRSTVVHVSPANNNVESSSQTTIAESSSSWKPLALEERRIVLHDRTQIIVESQNEFVFIGPNNAKIVLSCLPLFCIPNENSEFFLNQLPKISAAKPTVSPPKNNGWISFSQSIEQQNGCNSQTDIPPLPNIQELVSEIPIDQELPGDIFTILDPFEADQSDGFNVIEQSTRSQKIDDAFEKAIKNDKTLLTEDERCYSDSDDNINDDDTNNDIEINYVADVKAIKLRTASVSFVTINQATRSKISSPTTPLPSPPNTLFPRYVERGGWLIKLSHQKGMFGDKWQKRYFILNGPKLSYFKKYGDSQPKGVVHLVPGSWCRNIPQGTPRMSDAVAKTNRSGVISVNRCLAVHKPSNYASTLSALVASEGVADAFHSQTVALSNTQDSSRTFYMIASSEQERHAWKDAITNNIDAYKNSEEALDIACDELKNVLKAVGSTIPEELSSVLLAVHTIKAAMLNIRPS